MMNEKRISEIISQITTFSKDTYTNANSFVGSRQSTQKNDKGPDTADRLINYID